MFKKRLLYTKILVVLSIVGSLCSYYTIEKGWGEVYPFFTYKLFSQPRGSSLSVSEYKIYAKQTSTGEFMRIPLKETKTFNSDEYFYALRYYTDMTLVDSINKTAYKQRLFSLVKHLVPGMADYKIVQETYQTRDLLKETLPYDTITIVSF